MTGERPIQIGELAEHVGVSSRSLRHYEQQGLLSPTRGSNGYRVFTEGDLVRAGNIKELLDTGLTTADVRQYLDEGCLDRPLSGTVPCAAELPTLHQRLANLDELIGRLQRSREKLAAHTSALEDGVLPG